jgi:hypothetical protein
MTLPDPTTLIEPAGTVSHADVTSAATQASRVVTDVLNRLDQPQDATDRGGRLFPHGITSLSIDVSLSAQAASPQVSLKVQVSGPDKPVHAGDERQVAQQARSVSFLIRRYTSTTLSDARADAILAASQALLRRVDGTDDVAANVSLSRSGTVDTFTVGNGIISSQADYNQIRALATGQRVMMVNQILFCGGKTPSPGFIFIGCADRPGTCMILVRTTEANEPVLWAHEFGHNCGLGHRDVESAVMNGTVGPTHTRINGAERNGFEGRESGAQAVPEATPGAQIPADVREFVLQRYIHGIPHRLATQFTSRDVPELLSMLGDRQYKPYWANIVSTICMIGDPGAADPVLEFLAAGGGMLDTDEYDAKCMALMNLGRLISRAGTRSAPRAFKALEAGVDPDQLAPEFRWMNPYGLDADQQRVQVAKMSAWGLGLTGSEEAARTLRAASDGGGVRKTLEFTAPSGEQSLPDLFAEVLAFQESGRA